MAQFSHSALLVLNVQWCKNFGKMEKCKLKFFVNDWLKVLDINQAETGGDFWNFDPFQTAFIEINTELGLSRASELSKTAAWRVKISVSNIWCTGHFCNSSVCPCKQVFLEKQRLFCSNTMHHVSLANFKTFGFLLYHNPTWTDIFFITRNSTLCFGQNIILQKRENTNLSKNPPLQQVMGAGVLSHIYPSLELKNAENLPKFRHHPLAPGGGAAIPGLWLVIWASYWLLIGWHPPLPAPGDEAT